MVIFPLWSHAAHIILDNGTELRRSPGPYEHRNISRAPDVWFQEAFGAHPRNSALVRAAVRLAPDTVEMSIYCPVLKNALDWAVGSGELVDKPIALINASRRATHAWASLALDENGIVEDPALSMALRSAIDALVVAARDGPTR